MGNTTIQLRNETAANWTTNNPTLAQGEMGLETDTNRIKFGTGTTAWNSLPYVGAGTSFKYGLYQLSADQTSNLAVGNHIEWNTKVSGSLNAPSTGSGQANGIITLAGGKSYKIQVNLSTRHSSAGYCYVQVYDRTNSAFKGIAFQGISKNYSTTASVVDAYPCIITPTTDIDIDTRITSVSYLSNFEYTYTSLLIEEYGGY